MSGTAVSNANQNYECPICKGISVSSVLSVTTNSTYAILVCNSCGLAFAAPRPTAEELKSILFINVFYQRS